MTFDALCTAVFQDLNLNTVPSAATLARIRRYLNEGVRAVMREPGLERLADSDVPYSFTSVAGQARYAIPAAAARIQRIYAKDWTLEAMPKDHYRRGWPDAAFTSGTPTHYVPLGAVAVAIPLTATGVAFAVSTNAADTTQMVHTETVTAYGEVKFAATPLFGTVRIGVADGVNINDLYLSAPAQGLVMVVDSPVAGEELARIYPGTLRPRYTGFYLWPTPAGEVTYAIDYRRELADLINDSDEPPLPTDFHPMIAAYARMREYEKADDERYAIARAEYERAMSRLKFATQWASDELPVLGRAGRVGHSRLGANYPADSWK